MKRVQKIVIGVVAAGALAGGAAATTVVANAASAASSASPSASPSSTSSGSGEGPGGSGGRTGGHAGETALTGTTLATAKAVALKAVPGGTVDRAETDSGDAAYEVHMTKADGSQVTVKLTKSLTLQGVEDGMGR